MHRSANSVSELFYGLATHSLTSFVKAFHKNLFDVALPDKDYFVIEEHSAFGSSVSSLLYLITTTLTMHNHCLIFSRLYVFCLMWSLGALLELSDREKMETFLFNYKKEHGGLNLPDVDKSELLLEN